MRSQVSAALADLMPPSRESGAAMSTGRDAVQHQVAWQREMERAQLTSWFSAAPAAGENTAPPPESRAAAHAVARRHGGGTHGGAPPGVSTRDPIPAAPALMTSTAGHTLTTPGISSDPMSMQAAPSKVFRRTDVPKSAEAFQLPPTGRWPANVRAFAASITEGASRLKPSIPATESPAPLRLHAEERPEGQAVWIAMRANDEALRAMLPGIVADLQRGLRDRGERLHLVVCNGRPVWRDGVALIAQDNPIDQLQPREA